MKIKKSARLSHNSKILRTFGSSIRKRRESLGYTQEAFANEVGFSRSYYTEIESGKRNISLLNLLKILSGLKIDANSIIQTVVSQTDNLEKIR